MLKGIWFGLGFFTSILLFGMVLFAFILLLRLLFAIASRIRRKKASVAVWKKYMDKMVAKEEFTEASFVSALTKDKEDTEIIKLPPGYDIRIKYKIRLESNDPFRFKRKIRIIKTSKDAAIH